MPAKPIKSRLFVEQPLGAAQPVLLDSRQAHYIHRVMRLRSGGQVPIFNGRDGEWLSELHLSQNQVHLECIRQIRPQLEDSDVWLLMVPLRQARTEFAVEKAVELGVSRIAFVSTERAVPRRVNLVRLRTIAIEAAEQCGGMSIPKMAETRALDQEFQNWPQGRVLYFCDENAGATNLPFPCQAGESARAVLIGPEGGFSDSERQYINDLKFSLRISLGHRVLRAETAVVSALTIINVALAAAANSKV